MQNSGFSIILGMNFASSFANPTAEMTGTALKMFQGGKLVGDVVSTIGDVAGTADDFNAYTPVYNFIDERLASNTDVSGHLR